MARVKGGNVAKNRRRKVLKQAKGYFGSKHRLFKTAQEQTFHSLAYAYRDRKNNKRNFRKLWITRINAACRLNDISYSRFIEGLNKAGVEVNRKMLSEIAINDPKAFSELVKVAKDGKAGKITKASEVAGKEVTIGAAKATKKETKKEEVKEVKEEKTEKKAAKAEKVDYSKMTVAELKEVAAKKKISVTGMKKAEIIEALEK